MNAIAAFRIGDKVLVVDEYWGCKECDTPMGLQLYLFDPEEAAHWLGSWIKIKDEGLENGVPFPMIGRAEMVAAINDVEECEPFEEYGSLSDWMNDHATQLLQHAMEKRTKPDRS